MKIEKKIWPEYFEEVVSGKKTFELRLADWECNEGDILVLNEWNPETKEYTGRTVEKKVGYVLKTNECKLWTKEEVDKFGFQVISLLD
jgi:ASC-1-like (ASCH) protein